MVALFIYVVCQNACAVFDSPTGQKEQRPIYLSSFLMNNTISYIKLNAFSSFYCYTDIRFINNRVLVVLVVTVC
jgi:hypothetical protein